jgi:hypothetical protein
VPYQPFLPVPVPVPATTTVPGTWYSLVARVVVATGVPVPGTTTYSTNTLVVESEHGVRPSTTNQHVSR